LWGRGWYFEKIAVDPRDPDIVYVPNVAVNRSRDGGATWDVIRAHPAATITTRCGSTREPEHSDRRERPRDDHHAQRAHGDPRAMTWSSWLNQPTAQIYHASVDYRFPYWVVGAQQDSGAGGGALGAASSHKSPT